MPALTEILWYASVFSITLNTFSEIKVLVSRKVSKMETYECFVFNCNRNSVPVIV